MKKRIILITVSLFILFLTSCDKCQECFYVTSNGVTPVGELCGDDLEDAENIGYYDNDTEMLYDIHCEEK